MREAPSPVELGALAARALGGEAQAFTELVQATHGTLFRLALRLLGIGSQAEAEDVVQETYIRAWQNLGELRDQRAVLGWLCSVARHLAQDKLRQRGRRPTRSLDEPEGEGLTGLLDRLASGDADPEEQLDVRQLGAALTKAMEDLKEKYRVVLMLREVDGMSYEEIAEALDLSIGTVESRLHRARQALLKKLKKLGSERGLVLASLGHGGRAKGRAGKKAPAGSEDADDEADEASAKDEVTP